MTPSTYQGRPCPFCGGRERFEANYCCVECDRRIRGGKGTRASFPQKLLAALASGPQTAADLNRAYGARVYPALRNLLQDGKVQVDASRYPQRWSLPKPTGPDEG